MKNQSKFQQAHQCLQPCYKEIGNIYELEIFRVKFEDLAGQKLFENSVEEDNGQLQLFNNKTNLNIV